MCCSIPLIIKVSAKCDDRCFVDFGTHESSDYVPRDIGIGGGDYVKFSYCVSCGKIQDTWPKVVPLAPEAE